MKRMRCRRIAALMLALILALPTAAAAAETPKASSNINKQDYTTYGNTVKSYLYENGAGVTRVEYVNGSVIVEDYDASYNLTKSRSIQAELPIWGGFFAGKDANYLIFGQENKSESSTAEVIRVVKYTKDWQKQGSTSIKGAYTLKPFDGGSLRCAEENGYLYIHCARKMTRVVNTMYGPMDTMTNHQANLMIEIRESDMQLADIYDQIWNVDFGYVSHAFNQFILIDQEKNIVTVNHADSDTEYNGRANYGYAQATKGRGVDLIRYEEKAGQDHFQGKSRNQTYQWAEFTLVKGFPGSSGNNDTGASIGGFGEAGGSYITAFNDNGKGGGSGARDVYIGVTAKSGLKSTVTKVSTASGTTTPQLVSTGTNGGWVMWNGKSGYTANDTLYYTAYTANGASGGVKTATAPLSDCQPINHNGKAVWYVTNNSAPTFYALDAAGVTVVGGTDPKPAATPDPKPTTTPDPKPTTTPDPKPAPGMSKTNLPEVAVPSYAHYQRSYFSTHDVDKYLNELEATSAYGRQDIVTIKLYDASGNAQKNYKSSLANIQAGSTVSIRTGYHPNYNETMEVYLCNTVFPKQYTAEIQFTGKKAVLTSGTELNGEFNGCNTIAFANLADDSYFFFYLEPGNGSTAAKTPDTTKNPTTTTPPSTTTKPDTTTKPGTTTKPSTTTKPNTTAEEKESPFTDVPKGSRYYYPVMKAVEKGITTGVTPTQFQPDGLTTRGQVATFLWRSKGCPEPKTKTNPFTDVSPSSSFYKAILWAYENGITTGTSKTTFNPTGTCTEGHILTFIWRAEGKPWEDDDSSAFGNAYYSKAMYWADGIGDGGILPADYNPQASASRGSVVEWLQWTT